MRSAPLSFANTTGTGKTYRKTNISFEQNQILKTNSTNSNQSPLSISSKKIDLKGKAAKIFSLSPNRKSPTSPSLELCIKRGRRCIIQRFRVRRLLIRKTPKPAFSRLNGTSEAAGVCHVRGTRRN